MGVNDVKVASSGSGVCCQLAGLGRRLPIRIYHPAAGQDLAGVVEDDHSVT